MVTGKHKGGSVEPEYNTSGWTRNSIVPEYESVELQSNSNLKGYSSGQSYFSEINVKLAEKNKYTTHSVQRSLEMCKNK